MSKRKLIVTVLLLAVAVVAAVVVKREFFPAPGVTVQNFGRLHTRMFLHEIEAILGQPGVLVDDSESELLSKLDRLELHKWVGNDCTILISCSTVPRSEKEKYLRCIRSDMSSAGLCLSDGMSDLVLAELQPSLPDRIRAWLGF